MKSESSYRQNLTNELWNEKNREKRREMLDKAQKTEEYGRAEYEHEESPRLERALELCGVDLKSLDSEETKSRIEKAERISALNEGVSGPTPYAADLRDYLNQDSGRAKPELIELLSRELKGKNLVDLGCGNSLAIKLLKAFRKLGIRSYVGIDKYQRPGNYEYSEREQKDLKIPIAFAEKDMLEFLAMLPDKSVDSLMMSGIDSTVIVKQEYWLALAEEIKRSLKDNGLVISYASDLSPLLDEKSFEDILAKEHSDIKDSSLFGISIHKKIKTEENR